MGAEANSPNSYKPGGAGRRPPSPFLLACHSIVRLTVLLHDAEELDDDLGRRPDEDLSLALALGVDNAVKRVVEDGNADHLSRFGGGGCVGEWVGICMLLLDGYRGIQPSVPTSFFCDDDISSSLSRDGRAGEPANVRATN